METLLHQTPGTEAERTFDRDLATLPMRTGGLGLRSATRCAESSGQIVDQGEDAPCRRYGGARHGGWRRRPHDLTRKVSGGDCRGQSSSMASDRRRAKLGSQNTAGSSGLLPYPTRSSGRARCCQFVQPLVANASPFPTSDTMLEQRSPTKNTHSSGARDSTSVQDVVVGQDAVASADRRDEVQRLPKVPLDALGRHRAACPSTGRLKKRAVPIERVLAGVCREAGGESQVQRIHAGDEH